MLGLPPVPPPLKLVAPFLQRADELRATDPVVAYWCAYHAAQLGIAQSAKDPASRSLLFELLNTLEAMKRAIGPNDAIDIEAASAAYVENFALKVFANADEEDRRGSATRATARKFLAAANFLEVLKIFPRTEMSEATEEKIRYAKWKAADIARAFREGRTPAPGPAGRAPAALPSPPAPDPIPASPPTPTHAAPSSPPAPASSPKRTTPPPNMTPGDIARANSRAKARFAPPPGVGALAQAGTGDVTPGSWSTAATPGTSTGAGTPADPGWEVPPAREQRRGSGSSGSSGSATTPGALRKPVWGEGEGSSDGASKTVRFTPSVAGGSAPSTPAWSEAEKGDAAPAAPPPPPPSTTNGFPAPAVNGPPHAPAPPPAPERYQPPNTYYAPRQTSLPNPVATPPAPPRIPAPVAPPAPQQPAFELTPAVIAKAQKHCRFAISALDYEDAEQARRELRAALAILGE